MATTPSGFYYPDESTAMNINTITSTMASSVEDKVGPHIAETGWVNVTPDSGFSIEAGGGRHLRVARIGKIGFLSVFLTKTTGNYTTGAEAVATLPAAYRPLNIFWGVGRGAATGSISHYAINSSGALSIGMWVGSSDGALFSTAYPVA